MTREQLLSALVVGDVDPTHEVVRERFAIDPGLRDEWSALATTIDDARLLGEVREALEADDSDVPEVDVRAAIHRFHQARRSVAPMVQSRRWWPIAAVAFAAAALLSLLLVWQSQGRGRAPDHNLGGVALRLTPDGGRLSPLGQLQWTPAADAVSFVVELELTSGDRVRSRELTTPTWALLADHPNLANQAFRWRVLTLGLDGAEAASPWAHVSAP